MEKFYKKEEKMSGSLSDGSWTLTVFVTDLQVERSLRVRGDLHIGGVMIRLVDELGKKRNFYYLLLVFEQSHVHV